MIQMCKITSVDAEENVTFRNGTQKQMMRVWIKSSEAEVPRQWTSFVELWEEKIGKFEESGLGIGSDVSVEITPGYTRSFDGKIMRRIVVRILDLENE